MGAWSLAGCGGSGQGAAACERAGPAEPGDHRCTGVSPTLGMDRTDSALGCRARMLLTKQAQPLGEVWALPLLVISGEEELGDADRTPMAAEELDSPSWDAAAFVGRTVCVSVGTCWCGEAVGR